MFDARTFVETIDTARALLEKKKAIFQGEYAIHDVIFAPKESGLKIDHIFLRLRSIPKNIWNEKSVIVAIKQTEQRKVGKQSLIPLKKQFDTEKEARDFIEAHYSNQFEYLFEFNRIGFQYDLGSDQVDLEDIEGLHSIEFKSDTEEGLLKLLTLFDAKEVINGPSVVSIKDLLGR